MSFNLQTVDKSQQKTNKLFSYIQRFMLLLLDTYSKILLHLHFPRAACHPSVVQLSIFLINPR